MIHDFVQYFLMCLIVIGVWEIMCWCIRNGGWWP